MNKIILNNYFILRLINSEALIKKIVQCNLDIDYLFFNIPLY
jgi:hypothetical protein